MQLFDDFDRRITRNVHMTYDKAVLSIDDQEYLKPCGEQVSMGGYSVPATYCVKPVGHLTTHEDRNGRLRYQENARSGWDIVRPVGTPPVITMHNTLETKKGINPVAQGLFFAVGMVIPIWVIVILLLVG